MSRKAKYLVLYTKKQAMFFVVKGGKSIPKEMFFHGKTFNILFCLLRYIFQNYEGNPFSPSRGKNSQVNEPQ
jgi:hypothetical protein